MHEVYGDDVAQALEDPVWIREMTERNLVLFSKDARIKTVHRDAVIEACAKVYLLPDQSLRGDHMVQRYVRHKYRIAARSRKPGPHIYLVQPKALEHYKLDAG